MKTYDWILFDANGTLFSFDDFQGLKKTFLDFGLPFTDADYNNYRKINHNLWKKYEIGNISAQQLQIQRLLPWSNIYHIPPEQLNQHFYTTMLNISNPLKDAEWLLEKLAFKFNLALVTNGFIDFQLNRLKKTGFNIYFKVVITSEEAGSAKPHAQFFKYALKNIGNPSPDKVLMIGDRLKDDIQGGNNMGFDTCWVRKSSDSDVNKVKPTYIVHRLKEIFKIITHSKESHND